MVEAVAGKATKMQAEVVDMHFDRIAQQVVADARIDWVMTWHRRCIVADMHRVVVWQLRSHQHILVVAADTLLFVEKHIAVLGLCRMIVGTASAQHVFAHAAAALASPVVSFEHANRRAMCSMIVMDS